MQQQGRTVHIAAFYTSLLQSCYPTHTHVHTYCCMLLCCCCMLSPHLQSQGSLRFACTDRLSLGQLLCLQVCCYSNTYYRCNSSITGLLEFLHTWGMTEFLSSSWSLQHLCTDMHQCTYHAATTVMWLTYLCAQSLHSNAVCPKL